MDISLGLVTSSGAVEVNLLSHEKTGFPGLAVSTSAYTVYMYRDHQCVYIHVHVYIFTDICTMIMCFACHNNVQISKFY